LLLFALSDFLMMTMAAAAAVAGLYLFQEEFFLVYCCMTVADTNLVLSLEHTQSG
jgi:hypothetical protein